MTQIAQASSGIRALTSLSAGLIYWNGSNTFSVVDPADFAAASHNHNASAITAGTLDNDRVNWAAPAAIGSGTPAAITGTTINGTTITASTIVVSPGFRPAADSTTAMRFYKADGATVVGTIDTTNGRFGWGTTPTEFFEARKDQNTTTTVMSRNETNGASAAAMFVAQVSTSRQITFGMYAAAYSTVPAWTGKAAVITAIPQALILTNYDASGTIEFQTGGLSASNIRLQIDASGNVNFGSLTAKTAAINTSGNLDLWGTSSTTNRQIGSIVQEWATSTDASRKGRVIHNVYDTAAREAIRLEASGSAAMLGFFGVNAVVRPTALTAADAGAINSGDAGTDTVIGNIRTRLGEVETKLQALGLLT